MSSQNSLTYSFDNATGARLRQDLGLDGISTDMEFEFPTYKDYVDRLMTKLSPTAIEAMQRDRYSALNDPAGDNYHFYLGYDYDEQRLGVLERYKRYNGVEGNSLSPEDAPDPLYQSARSVPDVEDINQDNTLNEYERLRKRNVICKCALCRYSEYDRCSNPNILAEFENLTLVNEITIESSRFNCFQFSECSDAYDVE